MQCSAGCGRSALEHFLGHPLHDCISHERLLYYELSKWDNSFMKNKNTEENITKCKLSCDNAKRHFSLSSCLLKKLRSVRVRKQGVNSNIGLSQLPKGQRQPKNRTKWQQRRDPQIEKYQANSLQNDLQSCEGQQDKRQQPHGQEFMYQESKKQQKDSQYLKSSETQVSELDTLQSTDIASYSSNQSILVSGASTSTRRALAPAAASCGVNPITLRPQIKRLQRSLRDTNCYPRQRRKMVSCKVKQGLETGLEGAALHCSQKRHSKVQMQPEKGKGKVRLSLIAAPATTTMAQLWVAAVTEPAAPPTHFKTTSHSAKTFTAPEDGTTSSVPVEPVEKKTIAPHALHARFEEIKEPSLSPTSILSLVTASLLESTQSDTTSSTDPGAPSFVAANDRAYWFFRNRRTLGVQTTREERAPGRGARFMRAGHTVGGGRVCFQACDEDESPPALRRPLCMALEGTTALASRLVAGTSHCFSELQKKLFTPQNSRVTEKVQNQFTQYDVKDTNLEIVFPFATNQFRVLVSGKMGEQEQDESGTAGTSWPAPALPRQISFASHLLPPTCSCEENIKGTSCQLLEAALSTSDLSHSKNTIKKKKIAKWKRIFQRKKPMCTCLSKRKHGLRCLLCKDKSCKCSGASECSACKSTHKHDPFHDPNFVHLLEDEVNYRNALGNKIKVFRKTNTHIRKYSSDKSTPMQSRHIATPPPCQWRRKRSERGFLDPTAKCSYCTNLGSKNLTPVEDSPPCVCQPISLPEEQSQSQTTVTDDLKLCGWKYDINDGKICEACYKPLCKCKCKPGEKIESKKTNGKSNKKIPKADSKRLTEQNLEKRHGTSHQTEEAKNTIDRAVSPITVYESKNTDQYAVKNPPPIYEQPVHLHGNSAKTKKEINVPPCACASENNSAKKKKGINATLSQHDTIQSTNIHFQKDLDVSSSRVYSDKSNGEGYIAKVELHIDKEKINALDNTTLTSKDNTTQIIGTTYINKNTVAVNTSEDDLNLIKLQDAGSFNQSTKKDKSQQTEVNSEGVLVSFSSQSRIDQIPQSIENNLLNESLRERNIAHGNLNTLVKRNSTSLNQCTMDKINNYNQQQISQTALDSSSTQNQFDKHPEKAMVHQHTTSTNTSNYIMPIKSQKQGPCCRKIFKNIMDHSTNYTQNKSIEKLLTDKYCRVRKMAETKYTEKSQRNQINVTNKTPSQYSTEETVDKLHLTIEQEKSSNSNKSSMKQSSSSKDKKTQYDPEETADKVHPPFEQEKNSNLNEPSMKSSSSKHKKTQYSPEETVDKEHSAIKQEKNSNLNKLFMNRFSLSKDKKNQYSPKETVDNVHLAIEQEKSSNLNKSSIKLFSRSKNKKTSVICQCDEQDIHDIKTPIHSKNKVLNSNNRKTVQNIPNNVVKNKIDKNLEKEKSQDTGNNIFAIIPSANSNKDSNVTQNEKIFKQNTASQTFNGNTYNYSGMAGKHENKRGQIQNLTSRNKILTTSSQNKYKIKGRNIVTNSRDLLNKETSKSLLSKEYDDSKNKTVRKSVSESLLSDNNKRFIKGKIVHDRATQTELLPDLIKGSKNIKEKIRHEPQLIRYKDKFMQSPVPPSTTSPLSNTKKQQQDNSLIERDNDRGKGSPVLPFTISDTQKQHAIIEPHFNKNRDIVMQSPIPPSTTSPNSPISNMKSLKQKQDISKIEPQSVRDKNMAIKDPGFSSTSDTKKQIQDNSMLQPQTIRDSNRAMRNPDLPPRTQTTSGTQKQHATIESQFNTDSDKVVQSPVFPSSTPPKVTKNPPLPSSTPPMSETKKQLRDGYIIEPHIIRDDDRVIQRPVRSSTTRLISSSGRCCTGVPSGTQKLKQIKDSFTIGSSFMRDDDRHMRSPVLPPITQSISDTKKLKQGKHINTTKPEHVRDKNEFIRSPVDHSTISPILNTTKLKQDQDSTTIKPTQKGIKEPFIAIPLVSDPQNSNHKKDSPESKFTQKNITNSKSREGFITSPTIKDTIKLKQEKITTKLPSNIGAEEKRNNAVLKSILENDRRIMKSSQPHDSTLVKVPRTNQAQANETRKNFFNEDNMHSTLPTPYNSSNTDETVAKSLINDNNKLHHMLEGKILCDKVTQTEIPIPDIIQDDEGRKYDARSNHQYQNIIEKNIDIPVIKDSMKKRDNKEVNFIHDDKGKNEFDYKTNKNNKPDSLSTKSKVVITDDFDNQNAKKNVNSKVSECLKSTLPIHGTQYKDSSTVKPTESTTKIYAKDFPVTRTGKPIFDSIDITHQNLGKTSPKSNKTSVIVSNRSLLITNSDAANVVMPKSDITQHKNDYGRQDSLDKTSTKVDAVIIDNKIPTQEKNVLYNKSPQKKESSINYSKKKPGKIPQKPETKPKSDNPLINSDNTNNFHGTNKQTGKTLDELNKMKDSSTNTVPLDFFKSRCLQGCSACDCRLNNYENIAPDMIFTFPNLKGPIESENKEIRRIDDIEIKVSPFIDKNVLNNSSIRISSAKNNIIKCCNDILVLKEPSEDKYKSNHASVENSIPLNIYQFDYFDKANIENVHPGNNKAFKNEKIESFSPRPQTVNKNINTDSLSSNHSFKQIMTEICRNNYKTDVTLDVTNIQKNLHTDKELEIHTRRNKCTVNLQMDIKPVKKNDAETSTLSLYEEYINHSNLQCLRSRSNIYIQKNKKANIDLNKINFKNHPKKQHHDTTTSSNKQSVAVQFSTCIYPEYVFEGQEVKDISFLTLCKYLNQNYNFSETKGSSKNHRNRKQDSTENNEVFGSKPSIYNLFEVSSRVSISSEEDTESDSCVTSLWRQRPGRHCLRAVLDARIARAATNTYYGTTTPFK